MDIAKPIRTLVNEEITLPAVRVQSRRDGSELGTMAPQAALAIARQRGLDVVLSAPLAQPPICSIEDMGPAVYREELAIEAETAPPLSVDIPTVSSVSPGSIVPRLLDKLGEELREGLGADRFAFPSGPVAALDLPARTKWFLIEVGLPKANRFFDFDPRGLLRLDRQVAWWRSVEQRAFETTCRRLGRTAILWRSYVARHTRDPASYYCIGSSPVETNLCLEAGTGRVVFFDACGNEGYRPLSPINSDIVLLAQCLVLIETVNPTDHQQVLRLRDHLEKLDPPAFQDSDGGYWSLLIEELESGM